MSAIKVRLDIIPMTTTYIPLVRSAMRASSPFFPIHLIWIVIIIIVFIESLSLSHSPSIRFLREERAAHNSIFRNHNFLFQLENDYSFISNAATLLATLSLHLFLGGSVGPERRIALKQLPLCAAVEWIVHSCSKLWCAREEWRARIQFALASPSLPQGNSQVSNCIWICTLFCAHTKRHLHRLELIQIECSIVPSDCDFCWNVCLVPNAQSQRNTRTVYTRCERIDGRYGMFGPNDAWGQLLVSVMNCQIIYIAARTSRAEPTTDRKSLKHPFGNSLPVVMVMSGRLSTETSLFLELNERCSWWKRMWNGIDNKHEFKYNLPISWLSLCAICVAMKQQTRKS